MPIDTPAGTKADVSPANLRDQPSDDTLVARAVTIDRQPEELYAFWRTFSNLALIMDDIERIDVLDELRSHWVVRAPGGENFEWDSVVTEYIPNRRIAWRADDKASIKNHGWVEFRNGPTGRGTEVHALIAYDAPGGLLGRLIAKALQHEPNTQARRELRRFKQLMETGEITSSEGPRGGKHQKKEE
jgi:uncharacterized membrane protein